MAQEDDSRFPSERMERFIVRMPDGMRDKIRLEAEKNNRSMNAEIIGRLQHSLADEHFAAEETLQLAEEVVNLRNQLWMIRQTHASFVQLMEALTERLRANDASEVSNADQMVEETLKSAKKIMLVQDSGKSGPQQNPDDPSEKQS